MTARPCDAALPPCGPSFNRGEMSDPTRAPELNLKPRRAASAQSAAQAYGTTQAQAAPGRPVASRPAAITESQRGFLAAHRSEEHTSELPTPMRISLAVFVLKEKNTQ